MIIDIKTIIRTARQLKRGKDKGKILRKIKPDSWDIYVTYGTTRMEHVIMVEAKWIQLDGTPSSD